MSNAMSTDGQLARYSGSARPFGNQPAERPAQVPQTLGQDLVGRTRPEFQ
jgi:hypothetical protein